MGGGTGEGKCGRLPFLTFGSIPAWAGEPFASLRPFTRHLWPVYPRVGGGTICAPAQDHSAEGLSPRGRGNLLVAE